MVRHRSSNKNLLAIAAPVLTVMSAMASLYFMAIAGRRQQSIFLIAVFTLWVMAPFAGMLWINKASQNWPLRRRNQFCLMMVFISISSVIAYSLGIRPQDAKPAFTYLVFPSLSWALIIALWVAFRKTPGNSKAI